MPRHSYQCVGGHAFDAIVRWDEYQTRCNCGQMAERVYAGEAHVIDDTLPGGARYLHNLGDTPVWVETKTQYKDELNKRGLVQRDGSAYNKRDTSPWASRTRLRPGQHDPFVGRG